MEQNITFQANPVVLDKMQRSKGVEILQIVLYGFLLLLSIVFRGEDSIRALAESFDTKRDTVRAWMTFLTIISMGLLILSAALAGYYNGKVRRLEASCVMIEKAQVSGYCFLSENGEPIRFAIAYDQITGAFANGSLEGLNLTIIGKTGTYQCLAIESPYRAAEIITRLCQEKVENAVSAAKGHAEPKEGCCVKCGKRLNPDTAFCDKCGAKALSPVQQGNSKSEKKTVPTVVPILEYNGFKCPACDTDGQPINRKVCFNCGAKFQVGN